jgi:ABC-type transport system substrate-binding protein
MAVTRKELEDSLFKDKGSPIYVSGFAPYLEGWNSERAKRFDQLYGYNPAKAEELLQAAGYPTGTVKGVADWPYPGPGAGRSTHFHLLKAAQ